MKVKLKDLDNTIPYSSACMGFDSNVRVALNNGETVELNSIPEKGASYVVEVNSSAQKKSGGKK
tara:strand:- start:107 stop:298 length:192 start_codon:yes stop_codon:yes gene_type:complete